MQHDDEYKAFSLGCWENPENPGDPNDYENSDSEQNLRARVPIILAAGRFKSLVLYKRRPDWSYVPIDEFDADEG